MGKECSSCEVHVMDLQTGDAYCKEKGHLIGENGCQEESILPEGYRRHIVERFSKLN